MIKKTNIAIKGALYMTRWTIGRLRLHVFYQGDPDPCPHDHPFDFWTFPLHSYVEEVIAPKLVDAIAGPHSDYAHTMTCEPSKAVRSLQVVPRLRFTKRKAEHMHRVLGRWNGQSYTPQGWAYPGLPRNHLHNPGVMSGRVATIVWRGPTRREWGFLKNTGNRWCWQSWPKFRDGGRDAGCE